MVDTRTTDGGATVRRRRECLRCGRRFTTHERIEQLPLLVIKRDGRREPFDRNKIIKGLLKACEKRPIAAECLEQVANEVETALRNELKQEVESSLIGEMVMERLFTIDKVAYVRFASVYRQFADISRFMEELENLLGSEEGRK